MSRINTLDEPADIKAEKGSMIWARGVARKIWSQAKRLDSDVDSIQRWIQLAAENEVWRLLGYVSLDVFLVAEADISQSLIDAIRNAKSGTTIRELTTAEVIREKKAEHPDWTQQKIADEAGCSKPYVNKVLTEKSESNEIVNIPERFKSKADRADYRKLPEEIRAKVDAKEVSLNAAAISAGFRKKPTPEESTVKSFRKCENRLEPLRAIVQALDDHEKAVLMDWLQNGTED